MLSAADVDGDDDVTEMQRGRWRATPSTTCWSVTRAATSQSVAVLADAAPTVSTRKSLLSLTLIP